MKSFYKLIFSCLFAVALNSVHATCNLSAFVTKTDVLCRGQATGTITVYAEGNDPLQYSLNGKPYQTSNVFTGLLAGNYTVTVKDGSSCTVKVTVTIVQPAAALAVTTTVTNAVCSGSNTGSITANATGGTTPYSYSLNNGQPQSSGTFSNLVPGTYTVLVTDGNGCTVSKSVTVGTNPPQTCNLGYPDNSNLPRSAVVFNESEVLRAFDPAYFSACVGTATTIKLWYNDEHAMTLGVRAVSIKTSTGITTTNYAIAPTPTTTSSVSYPAVGSTVASGDQAGNDLAAGGGRPLWPALFITDITTDPSSRAGDWQQGGTPIAPHKIYGLWKAAVKLVDKTKNPPLVTITPDADPSFKDHWNLGSPDPVPAGLSDEGYGAEVVWNVSDLGLIAGHTYHLQFMVHDGDQNKGGGDVGEGCTTILIGGSDKTDETSSMAISSQQQTNFNVAIFPNPFTHEMHINIDGEADKLSDVRMYDVVGKLVVEKRDIGNHYDMEVPESVMPGMYIVEVKQGENRSVFRMIKQ